ncbi:DNA/RNA nuclease SfsA [Crassaminicella profunda]|uniref:DNA/RNA nuclease SfsA n=1 Tax=Crassaminicella profunda TaxID=1286698 RepID=UPI001CA655AD|nr:DNA/RNA nuclease SfsA [Crassaminicella profunda]QZY56381.1 DNA/RNA nuclease SfsA [Crassaminicella profunda]
MKYKNIKKAVFLSRPNRFIAHVLLEGKEEVVHVKNTGRCKEILIEGVPVILEKATNPHRKTKYSLVGAYKDHKFLINIDSQITNYVVYEAICNNQVEELINLDYLKKEVKSGNSRFDLYYEKGDKKGFIEVKSVTLEENGGCKFPDAPTQRGRKHIYELIELQRKGYENYIFFLIQIENMKTFTANGRTDPKFEEVLRVAKEKGIRILAYDCYVKEDELTIKNKVSVEIK